MISHSLSLKLVEYGIFCECVLLLESKRSQMGSIQLHTQNLTLPQVLG